MTKLIDWEARWADLEVSENVFALVVMAQIKAKRLDDGEARQRAKVGLIRLLYERGYSRVQIQRLFHIIDWMIQLPRELERGFLEVVYAIEEEKRMPYINTAERLGIEKGMEQGLEQGMEKGLEQGHHLGVADTLRKLIALKFGELPAWADECPSQASDEQLDEWVVKILSAESLEALLGKH
ncbi:MULTISPECIES: hypothetical protein [unclassified Ectothiorhodospira]|uniref:hypothetical protein n=1 Tax=unclassified Ectothiorhodospira TaxID=2684909 RepID=UPI001EE95FDE|nr:MULTISPECIES: hypothetical protein [unclassified Ectothiorhodospira]MCG5516508.1 hypothetical protein [Ectothiorhodospira sp. 9100]MCG5519293.1 hypothetical protein [Ectothiorhodospira sp. 9905]